ncbi:MAG TPA: sigma 54-interacting transcriptional regulator [Polyangia bacterium]|jgi:DNA-binding NtrC family response regulator|nr:sigma 54-interacting transcriptional regulator [Polyangia bacterium]
MSPDDAEGSGTVDEPVHPESDPDVPQPYLFVVLHCDHLLLGGARYRLAGLESVHIGRGAERSATRDPLRHHLDLRLPGSTISALHARLELGPDGWRFVDAKSRNGSYRNGERCAEAELRDGDLLQIGNNFLCYRAALPGGVDLDSRTAASPAQGLTTLVPGHDERLRALEPVARSQVPVLLLGETGTGKEVLARAIHTLSGRRGAFVAVNCGGLAQGLVEDLLFGHKKGAFTNAASDAPGFVRAADGGTLFLDEIGDLPEPAQAALLRVLQEGEVVPIGGTRPIKVDLRVVSATHRPLDKMAARGAFRSDLLGRLAGHRHTLVPLRERREDLGLLIGELLRQADRTGAKVPRLATDVGYLLLQYDWPLNIRELKQCLDSSRVQAPSSSIRRRHLPAQVREPPMPPVQPLARPDPSDEELRQKLLLLLERHRGNVSHVARDLGKARMQVHRWLQRFGIDPDDFRK